MISWALARLGIAAVATLLAFGGGWKLRDYQADAAIVDMQKQQLAEMQKQKEKFEEMLELRDRASVSLQKRLTKLRADQSVTQLQRAREYAKSDYTKCVVPDDGVRLFNRAIAGANEAATIQ